MVSVRGVRRVDVSWWVRGAGVALAAVLSGGVAPAAAQALVSCLPGEGRVEFGPTGETVSSGTLQSFVVPEDVRTLRLTVAGAKGGGSNGCPERRCWCSSERQGWGVR
jgi:hypothetical protein